MAISNKEDTYQHFFPPARNKGDYPSQYKFSLVQTCEKLEQIFDFYKDQPVIATDTETTELNHESLELVGFSFCCEFSRAVYVPLNHAFDGQNIDDTRHAIEMYNKFIEGKSVLYYNRRFDNRVQRFHMSCDVELHKGYDIALLVWLMDTNVSMPSLKWAAEHFLGWKMQTFEELVGTRTIKFIHPKEATPYAASDALATFHLGKKLSPLAKPFSFIFNLDNAALDSIVLCEETPVLVDVEYLDSLIPIFDQRVKELSKEVYSLAGSLFNIDSPAQVAQVLAENGCAGVDTTADGGRISTSKKALARIKHPLVEKILEYRTVARNRGSYVVKIKEEALKKGGKVHVNHLVNRVPCLTAESMLLTKCGFKHICDIKMGDFVWGRSGWDKVVGWKATRKSTVWEARVVGGRVLRGSYHHPVMTQRGSVWLSALKKGDVLVESMPFVGRGLNDVSVEYERSVLIDKKQRLLQNPRTITTDLAQMMGFVAGDGSVVSDGVKLCFNVDDLDLIEHYCCMFERLHGVKRPKPSVGDDHTVQYKYCYTDLRDYYQHLKVKMDEVPPLIMEAGPVAVLAFIGGYYDADGCLNSNGSGQVYPTITSKCVNRIKDMGDMLSLLGYVVTYGPKSQNQGDMWYLRVLTESCNLFMDEVKFESSRKRQRVSCVGKREPVLITDAEPTYKEVLYDITLEKDPWFSVAGILTHNTGRYATGTDSKNSFFSGINFQSTPKPRSTMYDAFRDPNSPTGWTFVESKETGVVEAYSPHLNIRRAFVAEPGFTWVSIDYSGQELRLPALFSREPLWVSAFCNGKDLHSEVAKSLYGTSYTKDDRKKVKILNFSLLYEGTPYSVSRALDCSEEEAAQYIRDYKSLHKRLYRWKAFVVAKARKTGTAQTFYGRPRRVRHWMSSPIRKIRAFAERTAINSPVQGTGSDLLKMALVKIREQLYKKYSEHIRFQPAVHDETNFLVRNEYLTLIVPQMIEKMTVQERGWPFAMTVSLEMGTSWGTLFPYEWTGVEFVPKGVHIEDLDEIKETV